MRGFVVEGAVVLEQRLHARGCGGALQLLADDVGILVGAHRQRGAQCVEPLLGCQRGGLFEAQAVARAAARLAAGGVVRRLADASGAGFPGGGVVGAFQHVQLLAGGPGAQRGQAVRVLVGGRDVRVHIGYGRVVPGGAQQAHRFQRARSAAGMKQYFHRVCTLLRNVTYTTMPEQPIHPTKGSTHGTSHVSRNLLRLGRHAAAHGAGRVPGRLFRGHRRVRRPAGAGREGVLGRAQGGHRRHGVARRRPHEPRGVLGGVLPACRCRRGRVGGAADRVL